MKGKMFLCKMKRQAFFLIKIRERTTLTACAATVAMAAPAAPIVNPSISVMSPTMLVTQAMDTKMSGDLESHIPLKTALSRL